MHNHPICKTKDQVAAEDENNIVYEIDCSNCEEVYFCEYNRSDEQKIEEAIGSVL